MEVSAISISAILIDPARSIDPEHVCQLENSISVIGMRTPITVKRSAEGKPEETATFIIVAGHARFEALRRRGDQTINAFILEGDDVDAGLWGLAENLDRRELSAIEAAELSAKFDRLLRIKLERAVQDAPPGGVQPNDEGIRRGAKLLGISRDMMRRRRLVAGLSAEAKAEAKRLGLADNQSALLAASEEQSSEKQVAKLRDRAAAARASGRKTSMKQGEAQSDRGFVDRKSKGPRLIVDEARGQIEPLSSHSAPANTAPIKAGLEVCAQSDEPDVPAYLLRLTTADEAVYRLLIETFMREIAPVLTSAAVRIREKFSDEINRFMRRLEQN